MTYTVTDHDKKLVSKLNEKMGTSLTDNDFSNWMEPFEDSTIFNDTVKQFLGEEFYHKLDLKARLVEGLAWKLGIGASVVGGVDFPKLEDYIKHEKDCLYVQKNQFGMNSHVITLQYLGYTISICCALSSGTIDLYGRTDCRVYKGDTDITHKFYKDDNDTFYVTLSDLCYIKQKIDSWQ